MLVKDAMYGCTITVSEPTTLLEVVVIMDILGITPPASDLGQQNGGSHMSVKTSRDNQSRTRPEYRLT